VSTRCQSGNSYLGKNFSADATLAFLPDELPARLRQVARYLSQLACSVRRLWLRILIVESGANTQASV